MESLAVLFQSLNQLFVGAKMSLGPGVVFLLYEGQKGEPAGFILDANGVFSLMDC